MADRKPAQLTAASTPLLTWVIPIQTPDGSVETNKITVTNLKTLLALTASDVSLGNVANISEATRNAAGAVFQNKSIDLGANTVTMTLAQLNTAVTDANI